MCIWDVRLLQNWLESIYDASSPQLFPRKHQQSTIVEDFGLSAVLSQESEDVRQ